MSHEISIHTSTGKAEMAYAGASPWHGLGTNVESLQTVGDMLNKAGLGWGVTTRKMYLDDRATGLGLGDLTDVEGFRAIVREDTGAVMGVASDRYVPISNQQAGDVVDALVTDGGAHCEVAGALFGGRRCWVLTHIPDDFEVVKGDLVKPYFLLAWGHDGKHGLAGKLTNIRVVCNNTLTAAGFGGGTKWSTQADIYIRHSKGSKLQIDEARKALGLARKNLETVKAAYQHLAKTEFHTSAGARAYFAAVFPGPALEGEYLALDKDQQEAYDSALERWNERQTQLLALYEGGKGAEMARGTLWGAYNAVTEYTDHVYPVLKVGTISQARQQSVLFGAFGEVKRHALETALSLVTA